MRLTVTEQKLLAKISQAKNLHGHLCVELGSGRSTINQLIPTLDHIGELLREIETDYMREKLV